MQEIGKRLTFPKTKRQWRGGRGGVPGCARIELRGNNRRSPTDFALILQDVQINQTSPIGNKNVELLTELKATAKWTWHIIPNVHKMVNTLKDKEVCLKF